MQRQIEVLRNSREDVFICGKNVECGSSNGAGEGDNSNSGATIGSDQPTSLLNFAISELVSWSNFEVSFSQFLLYHRRKCSLRLGFKEIIVYSGSLIHLMN